MTKGFKVIWGRKLLLFIFMGIVIRYDTVKRKEKDTTSSVQLRIVSPV